MRYVPRRVSVDLDQKIEGGKSILQSKFVDQEAIYDSWVSLYMIIKGLLETSYVCCVIGWVIALLFSVRRVFRRWIWKKFRVVSAFKSRVAWGARGTREGKSF